MSSTKSTKKAGRPRGRIWEYFSKVSKPPYSNGVAFATCVFCKPDGVTNNVIETIIGIEDRKQRVEKAISLGLIPGKPETLSKHISDVCQHASEVAKSLAAEILLDHSSKRRKVGGNKVQAHTPTSIPTPTVTPASNSNVVIRPTTDSSAHTTEAGEQRQDQQQTTTPPLSTPRILRHIKKEFFSSPRYNGDTHARLIAEFVSVHNLPHSIMASTEFRSLQDFYCNGASVVESNELQVTVKRISDAFLPFRAREAINKQKADILQGPLMSRGYTYLDNGWVSRANHHIANVSIGRPGFSERMIATLPFHRDHLNAVAIARGWEEFILACVADQTTHNDSSVLSRYTHIPNKLPVSVCSDSAGLNSRAKAICALRHPKITFLPCFAHLSTMRYVDLLTYSNRAKVVSDCLHIVQFFTQSPSKWLPKLRDSMKQVYNRPVQLTSGIVTRWTTTWQSCCSVLRAQEAFELVFKLDPVEVSKLIRFPHESSLKRVCDIVHEIDFWQRLTAFLYISTPTIESSLILQSGKATLGDILYCYGRQVQALIKYNEPVLLQLLEKQFEGLEFPLLFLSFFLHPRYVLIAARLVDSDKVLFCDVVKWITNYARKWELTVSDPTQSIIQWMCGIEGGASWCKHATACVQSPGDFWWTVSGRRKASNDGLQCMGEVANRVFSMVPNATDPEQVFSELGCSASPQPRVWQNDRTIDHSAIIAADVLISKRESDANDTNGVRSCENRRGEVSKSVSLISQKSVVFNLAASIDGGAESALSGANTTVGQNGAGLGTSGSECAQEESASDSTEAELLPTVHVEEEELTNLAASDFSSYVAQLRQAAACLGTAEGSSATCGESTDIDVLRRKSLERYALGDLPIADDKEVPEELLGGFRAEKTALSSLFDAHIVGELPSILKDL